MKKFIKIYKAILPSVFSSSTLALVISLVTNCVFAMFVSLKSHAVKDYICVYELPKLYLHLSTCSLSTDCA